MNDPPPPLLSNTPSVAHCRLGKANLSTSLPDLGPNEQHKMRRLGRLNVDNDPPEQNIPSIWKRMDGAPDKQESLMYQHHQQLQVV